MTFSLITAIATTIVGLASMGVGVAADVRGARLAVVTVGCVGVLVILVIIRFIFLG